MKPVEDRSSENEGKRLGQGQFANMPQDVMMKPYAKHGYAMSEDLDDSMGRLDGDEKNANAKMRANRPDSMY